MSFYPYRTRLTFRLQRKYDEEQRAASRAGVAPSRSMWVDKYRPKQFADLIGEDVGTMVGDVTTPLTVQRTHREVLSWLKQWDQCVYKRIPPGKKRKLAEADEANVYVSCMKCTSLIRRAITSVDLANAYCSSLDHPDLARRLLRRYSLVKRGTSRLRLTLLMIGMQRQ